MSDIGNSTAAKGGVLKRFTDADRGVVERPIVTPHLAVHTLDDGLVVLRAATFDTALRGDCFADLFPLLNGVRSRRDILAELADKHAAIDVQTALVYLASRGLVVSAEFEMDHRVAAFWSTLGASPSWADKQLRKARIQLSGDTESLGDHLDELGILLVDDEPTLSIVGSDYLDGPMVKINRLHRDTGTPWMPVQLNGPSPMLGPIFQPRSEGPCWECLAHRLRPNRQVETFLKSVGVRDTSLPVNALSSFAHAVSGIAATEIARWLVFGDESQCSGRVVTIDPNDFTLSHHVVMRRPQCRVCGDPSLYDPQRQPRQLALSASPRPVRNSGGVRSVPPSHTLERYRHLVSPVSGIVTSLERLTDDRDPWLHVYAGELGNTSIYEGGHYSLRGTRIRSAGKGSTAAQSEASALGEAIERFSCGYSGDEIKIRRSFEDIASGGDDRAIHPNQVQLFSAWQMDPVNRDDEEYGAALWVPEPFESDVPVDWTPVWSLTQGRHRYLPTALLYYDAPAECGTRFARGNSNGCSAGNTLEEAILQGFLELVERDSIAIWWFNRLRRPEVDFESFDDPYLAQARTRYQAMNRDLWMIDLTSDLGIPVFVAVSRRNDGEGERILYGFGSHFDARIAALRAICEVNQMIPLFNSPGSADEEEDDVWIGRWLKSAVIADHLHMAPDPEAAKLGEADYSVPDTEDVRDDVEHGRRLVEAQGLEFLVLDHTRPDVGMPFARVIVPGLRHFWRRLAPGRLYDVPVKMGWAQRPLAESALNPTVVAG